MIRWSKRQDLKHLGLRKETGRKQLEAAPGSLIFPVFSQYLTPAFLLINDTNFYGLMTLMLQVSLARWQEKSIDNGNSLINGQYYTLG